MVGARDSLILPNHTFRGREHVANWTRNKSPLSWVDPILKTAVQGRGLRIRRPVSPGSFHSEDGTLTLDQGFYENAPLLKAAGHSRQVPPPSWREVHAAAASSQGAGTAPEGHLNEWDCIFPDCAAPPPRSPCLISRAHLPGSWATSNCDLAPLSFQLCWAGGSPVHLAEGLGGMERPTQRLVFPTRCVPTQPPPLTTER